MRQANQPVGMAMCGGVVFLGQYYQIGRGYTPTEAGLLTIGDDGRRPRLVDHRGRLITSSGRIKPYVVIGSVVLGAGFLMLGTIDHQTSLIYVSAAMLLVGVGVGVGMQNLVLAVQNAVPPGDRD